MEPWALQVLHDEDAWNSTSTSGGGVDEKGGVNVGKKIPHKVGEIMEASL
jgi:hypothetical protein